MADFTTTNASSSTPDITTEIANGIYGLMKTYGNADRAFKNQNNSEYDLSHFGIVDREIDRIFSLISSLLSGRHKTADAETGEMTSPVQYYVLTTEQDLISKSYSRSNKHSSWLSKQLLCGIMVL